MSLAELPPPPDEPGSTPMPRDLNAERQILGTMLTNPRTAATIAEHLNGDEFFEPRHELIYDTAAEYALTGQACDPITLADTLRARPHSAKQTQLDYIGGPAYLHELVNDLITAGNADYHADIIARHALTRRALQTAQNLVAKLSQPTDTPLEQILDEARTALEQVPTGGTDATSSWAPVDLNEIRNSDTPRPQATIMHTEDGQGLIYPGRTHSIAGESTTGKTWITYAGVIEEISEHQYCTYIDFEDRADTLVARLDDMGAPSNLVDKYVRYIRPEQALDPTAWKQVEAAVKDCRLVILDGVTEAMTMHGWSLLDNEDVARWYAMLPRRIADLGPGVVEIDHVVKDKESRGRYAIGGAHKLNGITGCAYTMHAAKSFAIGQPGHSLLRIAKDRHGTIGAVGETVAELHMKPAKGRGASGVDVSLTGSTFAPDESGEYRLTGYMERVSKAVEAAPGISLRIVRDVVGGKKQHIDSATQTLIKEGYVRIERGPRNAIRHFTIRPFREES